MGKEGLGQRFLTKPRQNWKLTPPFNLSIFKRLLVEHKDHIWLPRTTPYTNQINKDLGFAP
jgi:hypothetical protein